MSELENQQAVSEAAATIEEAAPTPEIDEVGQNPEEAALVVEEEAALVLEEEAILIVEEEAILIVEEEAALVLEEEAVLVVEEEVAPNEEPEPSIKAEEPKPAPRVRAAAPAQESPEALMEAYISRTFKEGEIIKGTVVKVENDSILVDIGYKSEAVIPLKELSRTPVNTAGEVVKEGEEISCYVVKVEDNQGNIICSKRRADYEMAWATIKRAFADQTVLEAPVARNVKGGVLVDMGIWGFVPRSQVGTSLRGGRSPVGQELRLVVIELDEENRKFTCSARKVEEAEREKAKDKVFTQLKEGSVLSGKVARITNFGVFVDLGGVDGLIHISELTWGALRHPSKFVAVGQELSVKVLKFSPEEGKISLSLRQVEADPWEKVELKYPVGSTAQGKVVKLGKYGAIVELERGISGLVHISELSDDKVARAEDLLKVDADVLVKVINLKKSLRRITLSMKQTELEREVPPPRRDRERDFRDRGERGERSERAPRDRGDRGDRSDRGDRDRKGSSDSDETLGTLGDFWKELNKEEN
ncbi:MAG: 30S ribosomal protein S1 [Coprothermobacterota bacterium]|nr:30S ribosomal protein S1 [Coprothermobacterota bacterium]